jgi:uncharacterized delta-60 repeat protein
MEAGDGIATARLRKIAGRWRRARQSHLQRRVPFRVVASTRTARQPDRLSIPACGFLNPGSGYVWIGVWQWWEDHRLVAGRPQQGDDSSADSQIVVVGIVVISGVSQLALARLNTDGTLDTSLEPAGRCERCLTGGSAVAVRLTADCGCRISHRWRFRVARFLTNGQLDATFGVGGKVTTRRAERMGPRIPVRRCFAMTGLQPDGRIAVVGKARCFSRTPSSLQPDGSLDSSFWPVGGRHLSSDGWCSHRVTGLSGWRTLNSI